MNRRGFLKGLGGILAACAAPQALVGQDFKWKLVRRRSGLIVINPEYVNAPYEYAFLVGPGALSNTGDPATPIVFQRGRTFELSGYEEDTVLGSVEFHDHIDTRQSDPFKIRYMAYPPRSNTPGGPLICPFKEI